MYKLCKTEQSALRQRQLEQGLLQILQTQCYEDVSISELCDKLGVPRKSFYRYFSGKDGALAALIDHTLMDFEKTQSIPNATGLGDLEKYFVFWHENKMLLYALERSHLNGILVERSTSHALNEQLMPKYMKNMPRDIQAMALTFVVSGLLAMVLQWHNSGYRKTPKEMARLATDMLERPLISR